MFGSGSQSVICRPAAATWPRSLSEIKQILGPHARPLASSETLGLGLRHPCLNKPSMWRRCTWELKNHSGLWGAWVAQSVKHPTSAQVMISRFGSSSPRVGLCADSSELGACFRFCVSLSLCPSPVHALSLSVSKRNKKH